MNIKLWKDPFEDEFWKSPFEDIMIDVFHEWPSFVERNKKTSITTSDKDYRIHLAVPGLSKEDVKIGVNDSVISILHEKEKTDDKTFYFTSSFKKEYSLPDDCDEKNISSKLENGVLEIVIPRTKKKSNERFIEIN